MRERGSGGSGKSGTDIGVLLLEEFAMALLRPPGDRPRRPLAEYTTLVCPYNGFQVSFCRGLCVPVDGTGACGRLAPHALVGRTQAAIAATLDTVERK